MRSRRPTTRCSATTLSVAAGLGCALSMAPRAAVAQSRSTLAAGRAALQRGSAAYDVGDYETALRAFQDAYIALRDPTILLNVGVASERLGRRDEALRALRQYVERVPNAPDRAQVEARIAALTLAAAETQGRPTASAGVVAEPSAPTATGRGPASREPASTSVRSPSAPSATHDAPARPLWPWIVAGGGGAVAIAGGVLLGTVGDPWQGGAPRSEAQYLENQQAGDTQRAAGIALLAGGSVLALTGVVLGLALAPRADARPRVTVRPHGTITTGVAFVGVTFCGF